MTRPLRVALVGLGKIARDQHLPAMAASPDFECVAVVDPALPEVPQPCFATVEALLTSEVAFDAAVLCQPPQARFAAASRFLQTGHHVLLEKPPGSSLAELDLLRHLASQRGCTLYCAWHSRHAPAVEPALRWLDGRLLQSVSVVWKEDVRVWHPGQQWIWDAGGFGVFDPGINALSIVTRWLQGPMRVLDGLLSFPQNRDAPVSADLRLETPAGVPVSAQFDWLHPGPALWDIQVVTTAGTLRLREGGARLDIDGTEVPVGPVREYPSLYAEFAACVRAGNSDADDAPLRIVADAFLRSRSRRVAPFDD